MAEITKVGKARWRILRKNRFISVLVAYDSGAKVEYRRYIGATMSYWNLVRGKGRTAEPKYIDERAVPEDVLDRAYALWAQGEDKAAAAKVKQAEARAQRRAQLPTKRAQQAVEMYNNCLLAFKLAKKKLAKWKKRVNYYQKKGLILP